MIKAVIFDAGNVMISISACMTCDALARFSPLSPEEIYAKIFFSLAMTRYERGMITSEVFYAQIAKLIDAPQELCFEAFADAWNDTFLLPNAMIATVFDRLHPDIMHIILSNTNDLHWNFLAEFPLIKKYFSDEERLVLSYRQGVCKPGAGIFLEAIRRCRCRAEEIVYIDDNPGYVRSFKIMGGNGIVYNCQTDSIEYLINELSAYGV